MTEKKEETKNEIKEVKKSEAEQLFWRRENLLAGMEQARQQIAQINQRLTEIGKADNDK